MSSIRARLPVILGVVGAVLLAAGVIAIVVAQGAQRSAPQPSAAAASPVEVTPTQTRASTVAGPTSTPNGAASTAHGPVLARLAPTRLQVPAIHVDSTLKDIGLNGKGEIVTPPLDKDSHAYWLTVSPTPGQLGPATIIGHVDSAAYGPGVFFKLGDLHQRDKIYVTRSDRTRAMFEVERVVEYKKAAFPTQQVYGNIDHAGLRLITCGGTFDSSAQSYESNVVVYASLVSSRKA